MQTYEQSCTKHGAGVKPTDYNISVLLTKVTELMYINWKYKLSYVAIITHIMYVAHADLGHIHSGVHVLTSVRTACKCILHAPL